MRKYCDPDECEHIWEHNEHGDAACIRCGILAENLVEEDDESI